MNACLNFALLCCLVAVASGHGPFPDVQQHDQIRLGEGRMHRMGGPGGPNSPYGASGPGGVNPIGRKRHYIQAVQDEFTGVFSCSFIAGHGSPALTVTSDDMMGQRRMIHGKCVQCELCSVDGMECIEVPENLCF